MAVLAQAMSKLEVFDPMAGKAPLVEHPDAREGGASHGAARRAERLRDASVLLVVVAKPQGAVLRDQARRARTRVERAEHRAHLRLPREDEREAGQRVGANTYVRVDEGDALAARELEPPVSRVGGAVRFAR